MKDARQIAAETLLKMERRSAWSTLALDHVLRQYNLSSADSAFAGALFYGVIERRLTLDACIAAHAKGSIQDPEVRCALRLGIYQLLYMASVPDHTAVDESVKLVKSLRKPSASGFVNGVLRSFLRGGKKIPLPSGSLANRWCVEYSCPQPLVELFLETYPQEAVLRFLRDSLGRAPTAVRVNTLRTSPQALIQRLREEGVEATPHDALEHCLLLEYTGAVHQLESFRQGLFHLQDVSSQLCALALDARPGMRVLDACAAPGGKSFTLAQCMEDRGEITACDLHEKRVGLIDRRAREMGLACIGARALDMTEPHPDLGVFDAVLCDVPCSGYGVIRRKPEIKYKPLSEFTDIPNIQYKILENSAHYCKVGGRLLYSTCTLNPAENQGVTGRFLAAHPEFEPVPLGVAPLGEVSSRILMGDWGGDGFYLAAMVRRAAS